MKMYKIRKTGEIVEVLSYSAPLGTTRSKSDSVSYIDSKGGEHPSEKGKNFFWDFIEVADEKDFTNKPGIDLEQRRYELAKSAMNGILSDEDEVEYACSEATYGKDENHLIPNAIAQFAVACADALIAELKKEEKPAHQKVEKKEVQEGDIIEVDGEKYICRVARPEQDCSCCALFKDEDCKKPYGNCCSDYREDGKDFIFKKI